MRVYVEDYVFSYLSQYAQAGGYEERLAVLVGRLLTVDGQKVLFVNGAVQGKYCERDRGILIFSDKSIAYAREMIEAYFPGSEIVGWMQSQPSYGTFLNSSYAAYHKDAFQKDYHVLFVTDPVEGSNAFYTYNEAMDDLVEAKGYFIYYEKNPSMHEYMLENKPTDPPKQEEPSRRTYAREAAEPRYRYNRAAAMADQRLRGRTVNKPSQADPRRTMNLVASLCAVLVILCIIMGAGLVAGGLLYSAATAVWLIVVVIGVMSLGNGMFQSPNTSLIMSHVPRDKLGVAGSVNGLVRNAGMAFGVTAATIALNQLMSFKIGYPVLQFVAGRPDVSLFAFRWVMIGLAVICLLGAALTGVRLAQRGKRLPT